MEQWRSPHDRGLPNTRKKRALYLAIVFSFLAFFVQLLGSLYTGSIALFGDTAHLFADLFSLLVSLIALLLAAKPTSELRSFGLFRLEVLASFINGLLLFVVSLVIAWESIERLRFPHPVMAGPLLLVAFAGLALNLMSAAALWLAMKGDLLPHSHAHGHGHDHHHHHHHDDRNLKSALLHVMSDALGSLAVMVGAVAIHYTGFVQLDAVIGLVLSFLIVYWSLNLMKDTTHVLLESTPKHIHPNELLHELKNVDLSIQKVEDVHVWEITSRMYAATGEIFVDSITLEKADEIRHKASHLLRNRYGIAHAVLAVRRT